MTSNTKALLRSAKEKFDSREYRICVDECQQALRAGVKNAYDAYILLGKAAYLSELWALSDKAYDEAARLQPEALPAWKGLAELHNRTQDQGKIIDAYTQLVGLTTKEPLERQWEYHLGLASALHSSGRLAEARAQLCQSVRRDWSPLQHATLLAQLSDVLVAEQKPDAQPLQQLVGLVGYGVPQFEGHYRRYIQQLAKQLHALPAGSEERVKLCKELAQTLAFQLQHGSVGGCAAAAPLELLLQLWDEAAVSEALGLPAPATASAAFRSACLKLLHAFPTSQAAWPAAALALHWQKLHGQPLPSSAAARQHASELLQRGSLRTAACASAWFLAASLWLQGGAPAKGLAAAAKGMQELTAAGYASDSLVVASLQVLVAEACLPLGQLDNAATHATSVVEAASSAGGSSTSPAWVKARQKAEAVLAHVLAARGNTAEAEQAWLQLLHESSSSAGGTAEGESPPGGLTPHWLLGGYGKLLADQHRYQEARLRLGEAVSLASRGKDGATDSELACHLFHLGRAHWGLKAPRSAPSEADAEKSHDEQQSNHAQKSSNTSAASRHARADEAEAPNNPFKDALAQLFPQQAAALAASPADTAAAQPNRASQHIETLQQNGSIANGYSKDLRQRVASTDANVQKAAELWTASAAVASSCQAAAHAWLGVYHREAEGDEAQAKLGFETALAIDPRQPIAGKGLLSLLSPEAALKLSREASAREPAAAWAWAHVGIALARAHDSSHSHDSSHAKRNAQQAVAALQAAVRLVPDDVASWEALGDSYRTLGRYTGSLKAYERALAIDPRRLHALVHSAQLHLSLAAFQPAAQAFAAALQLHGSFPPALLGAAGTLYGSALQHCALGCSGTAAQELAEAGAQARACTAQHGHLAPAWKLLGDILLQSSACQPVRHCSLAADAGQRGASTYQQDLARWQQQLAASQAAVTAYAKALHLNPACGEAWGDAAAAKVAEATLRRAHASFSQPSQALALRQAASRLLRGALRLQPASPQLWAALGAAAPEAAAREYALCRALTLEPKNAVAWAALGREYCSAGDSGLAARCFTLARSQEPTCAAAWEGMGALAALSDTGAGERLHVYEHAVGLRGGFESLLGFVEGAAAAGRAHEAAVYVAACRAAEMQPLSAAAQHARGLVCEARAAVHSAVSALRTAADIIRHPPPHLSGDELDQPLTDSTGPAQEEDDASQGSDGHQDVQHTSQADVIHLNLARLLSKTQQHEQAAQLYGLLQALGALRSRPEAACSYAAALEGLGERGRAQAVLRGVIDDDEAPVKVCFAAIQQLLRLQAHSANPSQAAETLATLLPTLRELAPPAKAMQGLWLGLLAALVKPDAASRAAFAEVRDLMHAWELSEADNGSQQSSSAEWRGQLTALEASCASQAGHAKQAVRRACKALLLCPWSLGIRLQAASCAAAHHTGGSSSAAQLCFGIACLRLQQLPCSYNPSPTGEQRIAMARSFCVACIGQPSAPGEKLRAQLPRWLHEDPRLVTPQQWGGIVAETQQC